MVMFNNQNGNNNYRGTAAEYDQVNYQGALADYTLTQNANGTITISHPQFGTDTLTSIEGLWFNGEQRWYSMEEALQIANPGSFVVDQWGVLNGTNGDDVMSEADGALIFYGGLGDDTMQGTANNYNQAEYDGARADYTFTQNANGSVTVTHPTYGTDTLTNINGFWFRGESQWYSMEDVLDTTPPGEFEVNQWGVMIGTNGDDVMTARTDATILFGGDGNDTLIGQANNYTQAEYGGWYNTHVFEANADGSVSVTVSRAGGAVTFTDTLTDIDGIWFRNDGWFSMEDMLANTGTFTNGVWTGSNDIDDALFGGSRGEVFSVGMGIDTINGGDGRDTLRVDGDAIEWIFSRDGGDVIMSHATWGENTLTGIEDIWFARSGETLTINEAIAATAGLPDFRLDGDDVLNGTFENDVMRGDADGTNFYGGTGNDRYIGSGSGYDQVNFDGLRSEYTFTQNANGSVRVTHDIWGTDTLTNIDGLVFTGSEPGADGAVLGAFEWIAIDDVFGG